MEKYQTSRYQLEINEIAKGGPGGYESVYLNSEGDSATDELYHLLEGFTGVFLPAENRSIRQRNSSQLVEAIKGGKSLGIASGFKPSGAYHFGHKLTSGTVAFMQKNGVQVFMPVADLECDMDTKISKEDYMYWAADNLVDWGANGVNLDASHVYLQSEEKRVSDIAYLVARGLTFDLAVDTYGFKKMADEFPFLFAGITQVGDIILPQHRDFGNYHSFMVSGQDQDGHMKMTVELAKRAFDSKISLLGIQTIPSGFYIPHIRGIIGKASSSKPEATLYLGSGPLREDLEGRIKTSLQKLDSAMENPDLRSNLEKASLDVVRYIEYFNSLSKINFGDALKNIPADIANEIKTSDDSDKSYLIDDYLLNECKSARQDNIQLVRETISEALKDHQRKRQVILDYAVERENYRDLGAWTMDSERAEEPDFWKVPDESKVNQNLRNRTQWFNMVASMKDKIVP